MKEAYAEIITHGSEERGSKKCYVGLLCKNVVRCKYAIEGLVTVYNCLFIKTHWSVRVVLFVNVTKSCIFVLLWVSEFSCNQVNSW